MASSFMENASIGIEQAVDEGDALFYESVDDAKAALIESLKPTEKYMQVDVATPLNAPRPLLIVK